MPRSVWSPAVTAVCRDAARPRTVAVMLGAQTVQVISPFPSPADWRDQWIYFLLVDRFNNASAPPRHLPFDGEHDAFQGGNFEGIRQRLGYLQQLGVGAIWLSPVIKNPQFEDTAYHGYGFQDFLRVEPRFTSDPAAARANPQLAETELRRLVDEAHAHGIYVIFDIVLNHAGNVFAYDGFGAEAPFASQPYSIHWRDANGQPAFADFVPPPPDLTDDAAVWPQEFQRNALFRRQGRGGEAGGDFASLKELATDFREPSALGDQQPVHQTLIRAYQYIIARYDVDGFRIDTLKFVEASFARKFGNSMREFALSIGKRDFFTFGEVFDDEEKIARFIGRDAGAFGEPVGVDAALDFPLLFTLPDVAKGFQKPTALGGLYERRKQVQRGLLTSHGEASGHFVTFLDNHDMYDGRRERFYFDNGTGAFDAQATLGFACLFALQGIPCLYYGSEQGLHGRGSTDRAVREALWGRTGGFDPAHPFYRIVQELARVRTALPALRYGRQYFRQVSGDRIHFGFSSFAPGIVAFSRILNDSEIVLVANTMTSDGWTGEVIVDAFLQTPGDPMPLHFSNLPDPSAPGTVLAKQAGSVEIASESGAPTHGPACTVAVQLRPMEAQIFGRGA